MTAAIDHIAADLGSSPDHLYEPAKPSLEKPTTRTPSTILSSAPPKLADFGLISGDGPSSRARTHALDCVVVGYKNYPLNALAATARLGAQRAGDYGEFRRNSYLVEGRRLDFNELLNHRAERALGFNPSLNSFKAPNLGAFHLAHYLLARGYRAEVVNYLPDDQARLDELLAQHPISVAITTTFYVGPEPVQELVAHIRARSPQSQVIIGGPYIVNLCLARTDAEQDTVFRALGADILILDAQGETTLTQVLDTLLSNAGDLRQVPNLAIRASGGSTVRTPRVPESNPLADTIIDWRRFSAERFTPVSYLRTSRSCPFSCSFCNYPSMGGRYEVKPETAVLKELRQLREAGSRFMIFTDDTLNVPLPRFKSILRSIIRDRLDFRWVSFFRCSHADAETFDLMRASGCLAVYLGIESADESVLRAMNKYATVDQYREAMARLHQADVLSFASFIIGFPTETRTSVLKTIEFIQENRPTFFNAGLYFHNPLAPIHQRRAEFGIEGSHYRWVHNTMTWQDASALTDLAMRSVSASIQLPLWGFSIWSVPYLLAQGFSIEQIKRVAAAAQRIMLKGMDDGIADYTMEYFDIDGVLRTWGTDRGLVPANEDQ